MTKIEYLDHSIYNTLKTMMEFPRQFSRASVVLLVIACLVSTACQSMGTAQSPQPPIGDPWFGSARIGDWDTFRKLQAESNRPWDYQSRTGTTALMAAARYGQTKFVENLLKNEVGINRYDRQRYNALSYALHGPTSPEVQQAMCLLLVENGADAFFEDRFKLSGILVMIELGFEDCIRKTKLSEFIPCDQAKRLTEVRSLVTYAEKEEEFKIRDYLKAQGCE